MIKCFGAYRLILSIFASKCVDGRSKDYSGYFMSNVKANQVWHAVRGRFSLAKIKLAEFSGT